MEYLTEDESKRITSMRFLLAILVVMIHSCLTAEVGIENGIQWNEPLWITYIKEFLVLRFLAQSAVPLFFLFSGYFNGIKNYSYKELLSKKKHSLIIPYIIWIIITIVGYMLLSIIPFTRNMVPEWRSKFNLLNWTAKDYLRLFYNFENKYWSPVRGQLWYVRELIFLSLLTPFLKKVVMKFGYPVMISLTIMVVTNFPYYKTGNMVGLWAYFFGLFCGSNGKSFFKFIDNLQFWQWFVISVVCFSISFETTYFQNFDNILVLLACCLVLSFSRYLIRNTQIYETSKYLSGYSFFVYAVHMPFLKGVVNKMSYRLFNFSGCMYLVQFIVVNCTIVVIATLSGILLKRFFPKIFAIINGR